MNDAYEKLRKPMPQILGGMNLLCIAFGASDLALDNIPLYLKLSTIFEILISVFTFLILLFREPENHEVMKRNGRIFFIIDILAMYCLVSSIYNIYFFLAVTTIDLFGYWVIGTSITSVCFLVFLSGIILLNHTPKWMEREGGKNILRNKFITLFILMIFSSISIFYRFLEYFLIPHINDNEFVFISMTFFILAAYVVMTLMYIHYIQILTSYELDDSDIF